MEYQLNYYIQYSLVLDIMGEANVLLRGPESASPAPYLTK